MDIFTGSMRAILLDALEDDDFAYLVESDSAVAWAYDFLQSMAVAIRERGK